MSASFGVRPLQNHTGYEPDTGLPIPGNFAALALAVLLAGLAAVLALTARLLPAEEDPGPVLPRDFSTENAGLLTVPMCGVFLLALSGLADLAESLAFLPEGLVSSRHAIYGILRAGGLGFSPQGQMLLGVLTLAAAASRSRCWRAAAGGRAAPGTRPSPPSPCCPWRHWWCGWC